MSSKQQNRPTGDRRPELPNPRHQDKYPHSEKSADASVCKTCGVVLHGGRWRWGAPPVGKVQQIECPACVRIRTRDAVGTLRLDAPFRAHRDEIQGLVRNEEQLEKEEHPLERVLRIEDAGDGLVVETTGLHLARRIANKLERRFHRQASFHYGEEPERLIVDWKSA